MQALARYGLQDAANRTYETLSGGQKARLEILCLEAEGHNLLLLDEPTDNLDIDSSEALERALDGFEGTVVAVSHDRAFLDAWTASCCSTTTARSRRCPTPGARSRRSARGPTRRGRFPRQSAASPSSRENSQMKKVVLGTTTAALVALPATAAPAAGILEPNCGIVSCTYLIEQKIDNVQECVDGAKRAVVYIIQGTPQPQECSR